MNDRGRIPRGLHWRSSTRFIISTVTVVPVIPFILRNRVQVPQCEVQFWTSFLLACSAGANLLFSLPAGFISDRSSSRQWPFLAGLYILWLVIARILQGMSAAVVWTVGMALAMDTVGSDHLGEAIGIIFSTIRVAELLSPLVGGLAYDRFGSTAVFGVGFVLIIIDFIMRLLLIEKKVAAEYAAQDESASSPSPADEEAVTEGTPLLSKTDEASDEWINPPHQPDWVHTFPLVYCPKNPRLLVAMCFTLTQAVVLGIFDATLPLEAQKLYGFSSLQAGLLVAPLVFPNLVLGPLAGKAVDKFGTKLSAVVGVAYLAASLNLLHIPHAGDTASAEQRETAKLCIILAVNSIGFSIINSPAVVEQTHVVKQYHLVNKNFFGDQGPYSQLYAINSMFFCLGLSLGPLAAGALREQISFGDMNTVIAGLCIVVSILSYFYIGNRPRGLISPARIRFPTTTI
ncbi:MFS transporter-like protein [Calycina marina]|uniref:MFS transporter-like protein n=1 Tax=Calycina marina TaxID=1763456 RepID=A0A9P7Z7Z6_9HELO|nr:MFS transporter-like protein [Calycina marina]